METVEDEVRGTKMAEVVVPCFISLLRPTKVSCEAKGAK